MVLHIGYNLHFTAVFKDCCRISCRLHIDCVSVIIRRYRTNDPLARGLFTKASIVGWSDGGNIGIDIAINNPDRLVKLFAFGANFNPSGVKPTVETDAAFGAYVEHEIANNKREPALMGSRIYQR